MSLVTILSFLKIPPLFGITILFIVRIRSFYRSPFDTTYTFLQHSQRETWRKNRTQLRNISPTETNLIQISHNKMSEVKDERSPSDRANPEFAVESYENQVANEKALDLKEGIKDLKQKLSTEEIKEIKDEVKEHLPGLEKSLEESEVNTKGVYCSLVVSIIFMILCIIVTPVKYISWESDAIKIHFESQKFSETSEKLFADIGSEEDMDKYIRNIVLPSLLENKYINAFNYNVGARFTLKTAKFKENPFEKYRGGVTTVREDPELTIDDDNNDGENTEDYAIWKYSEEGGYNDAGGYTMYFLNGTTSEKGLLNWRTASNLWLEQGKMSSLVIEMVYHNRNYMTTLYYEQRFLRSSEGKLHVTSRTSGIFTEMYSSVTSRYKTVLIFAGFYFVGLLFQIFTLLQNLYRTCKHLCNTFTLDLVWHEYLELFNVSMVLTSIGLFVGLAVLTKPDKLPYDQKEDFDELIEYAISYRTFLRVAAIAVLLTGMKLIVVLKKVFPSFGVLFDTIRHAKNDIINFSVISMVLLTGFALMGYIAFGHNYSGFSSVSESFLLLFDMILGSLDYYSLHNSNPSIAGVFFLVFLALFFFILLNMFLAIVLNTYVVLRGTNQIILEAKSRLLHKKFTALVDTVLNLIFLRVETTIENDAAEYNKIRSLNADKRQKEAPRLNTLSNIIKDQYNKSWLSTIKHNFGKINVIIKSGDSVVNRTREQYLKLLKGYITLINMEKKYRQKEKERLEKDTDHNYKIVKEMFIFILFIIVFVSTVLIEFRIETSFSLHKVVKNAVTNAEFDYNGHELELKDVISELRLYEFNEAILVDIAKQGKIAEFNHFVGDIRYRVTLRRSVQKDNDSDFSQDIFEKYRSPDTIERSDESTFVGKSRTYTYLEPGKENTFEQLGGYVVNIKSTDDYSAIFKELRADSVMDELGSVFAVEWVLYNHNVGHYIYCYVTFTEWESGAFTQSFHALALNLKLFDFTQITLHILFGLFTVYYIINEILEWWED